MSNKLNRQYKDRVFRDIFGNKDRREYTLSLYNAVNGTAYTDPELIELNTLEDFIYMNMKNDVSFLVDAQLELYEHQSTYNPNMPFRCLQYLSELYERYLEEKDQKDWLYTDILVHLPTPKCVVFYNGERETEDKFELHLKEAFSVPEKACMDLTVLVFNCNEGRNQELMEHCAELKDYARFVALSRRNLKGLKRSVQANDLDKENAVLQAIDEMIRSEGPLSEYFRIRRNEVCKLFLEDYNEEAAMKAIGDLKEQVGYQKGHEEGREEGRKAGHAEILEIIRLIKAGATDEDIVNRLHCSLTDIQEARTAIA